MVALALLAGDWYTIQVKHKERVGRPDRTLARFSAY